MELTPDADSPIEPGLRSFRRRGKGKGKTHIRLQQRIELDELGPYYCRKEKK